MSRISILIDHIKKENNLPIILLGHSRGSISVAAAANNLKKRKISGIVILGSITTPVGKYTPYTLTMKHMLKQTLHKRAQLTYIRTQKEMKNNVAEH